MCLNRGFYIVLYLFMWLLCVMASWDDMNDRFVSSSETWFRLAGALECYWSLLPCKITGCFSQIQIVSSKLVCAILPFALKYRKCSFFIHHTSSHKWCSFACPPCHRDYYSSIFFLKNIHTHNVIQSYDAWNQIVTLMIRSSNHTTTSKLRLHFWCLSVLHRSCCDAVFFTTFYSCITYNIALLCHQMKQCTPWFDRQKKWISNDSMQKYGWMTKKLNLKWTKVKLGWVGQRNEFWYAICWNIYMYMG